MTVLELIHALSVDDELGCEPVRLWAGDTDCVVTGVRHYVGSDGETRLDLEFVNRLQLERPGA